MRSITTMARWVGRYGGLLLGRVQPQNNEAGRALTEKRGWNRLGVIWVSMVKQVVYRSHSAGYMRNV